MSQVVSDQPQRTYPPFAGFLPFFWLACVFIGGILLADLITVPVWIWAALLGLFLLAFGLMAVLPRRIGLTHLLRRWTGAGERLPRAVLAAVFCLGAWRYGATRPVVTPEHPAFYNDRGPVQLVGVIVRPPDTRDRITLLTVAVETLRYLDGGLTVDKPMAVSGLVLIQAPPEGDDWAYGDVLQATGSLETPSEGADFSYAAYLSRQGVLSVVSNARLERLERGRGNPIRAFIYRLADRGQAVLQALFPSPESDLLAGILLGREQGLSPDLQEAFRRTGATHIIAISGFNIAILSGLFAAVFTQLLGRRGGALAAVAAISGYTILVGADAAVVRAAVMGAVGVLGGLFGRRQNGLNSIGIAALGMALWDPNLPWDVGFQLSLAATLGLVLYAQPLTEGFVRLAGRWLPEAWAMKLAGPVGEFFLFTLAAQAMTLPIMALHFGGVSWLALLANPLILPPQPLVMILGGLAMLGGMLLPGAGRVLASLALPFVSYTIRIVEWMARLPGGEAALPDFHPLWLVAFYGLLFMATLLPRERALPLLKRAFSPQTGLVLLSGLVVFVWGRVLHRPDGRLHLTLLDAEGTVLIQTPAGAAVLVGGGDRPSHLNHALGQMLPPGERTLDVLVAASPQRDDVNALLGVLGRYPPGMVWWGVDPEANATTEALYRQLHGAGAPLQDLTPGSFLELGAGAQLSVLWRGARGAVLWLAWEDFSALVPSGRVTEYAWGLPEAPDVLILPEDLSPDTLVLERIPLWSPGAVLLPLGTADLPLVGEHPVVESLSGYPLVTTLDCGWVRVSTDGSRMWVAGGAVREDPSTCR